jgi:outer membrane lipoprotein-sorting protein
LWFSVTFATNKGMFFTEAVLVFFFASSIVSADPAVVRADSVELLKKIDGKYLNAKTISMNVNKTDKLSALDQTKNTEGTLQMKKGKFRLELQTVDDEKEKSFVIVDGKNLWLVTPALKDFKNSKTQVAKTSLKDKKNKSQSLLRILTEGGVFGFFNVTSTVDTDELVTYFLKPNKDNKEMTKAQIIIDKEKQVIAQLKYWDPLQNETSYQFTKVEFDKPIKDEIFNYIPPKNAQVTQY